MKFIDNTSSTTNNEPHPHFKENLRLAHQFLDNPKVQEMFKKRGITQYWERRGPNTTGTDKDYLLALCFSWKVNGDNFACPISLHQASYEFKEEVRKLFGLK